MIKRIIARLDIKNDFLVKGMHLEGLRVLGYPEFFAQKYFEENSNKSIVKNYINNIESKYDSIVWGIVAVGLMVVCITTIM